MNDIAHTGEFVIFTGIGGYSYQPPEAIEKGLVIGYIYKVKYIDIGSNSYELEGFEDIWFSALMFELV